MKKAFIASLGFAIVGAAPSAGALNSVVISTAHIGCDPNAAGGVGCGMQPGGLRHSGTLNGGTYTLGAGLVPGWSDVLRLIYFGLLNDGTRDCASPVRLDLVNTYGNLFETGGCGSAECTQLTHAWRPDTPSATATMINTLLGAVGVPFCNVSTSGGSFFSPDYQDLDPIRRTCVGGANGQGGSLPAPTGGGTVQPDFPAAVADQVCGPVGTLGLVLPVRVPVGVSLADVYPTRPCFRGRLNFGPAPKIPGTNRNTLCPNGDVTLGNTHLDYDPITGQIMNSSGICLIPADSQDSSQCINGKNNFPSPIDPPVVIPPALRDGRVYNLHLYGPGNSPLYRVDTGTGTQVVGAFLRIHATRTLVAAGPTCPGTACCNLGASLNQIGCLSEADHCSIGTANAAATLGTLVTSGAVESSFAASINGIGDRPACAGFFPF